MIFDYSLSDFPRFENEKGDSKRILRAIEKCGDGVLFFPKGEYSIDEPIIISNHCSLLLHKSAILTAVKEMDFVITIDNEYNCDNHDFMGEAKKININLNQFFSGGIINADGLASCLKVLHYRHFTLKEASFLNGKKYGLYAGGYYELIVNNICCKCTKNGLSGNYGIYSDNGDSHYTDISIVDYTTGIAMCGGGANRLTRCHIWGGPVKPLENEKIPEMLKNSVCYLLSSEETILRDCYADTAEIGFLIEKDAKLLGCAYFNNDYFGLDNIVAIKQTGGTALVNECTFTKSAPHCLIYTESGGKCVFRNTVLRGGFTKADISDDSAIICE